MLQLTTTAPEETEAFGRALAALTPLGTLIALQGGLATGKTCLVRGMASHFMESRCVHSPTFTLINEYGQKPTLYHLDLYRIGAPDELAELGLPELLHPQALCVIEWAERAKGYLPQPHICIKLEHAGRDRRTLTLDPQGLLPDNWQSMLAQALGKNT